MNRWCTLSPDQTIPSGQFLETMLQTNSGKELHSEDEFIDYLAVYIMKRYEGSPDPDITELPGVALVQPARTKHHYRRLFDHTSNPTPDFLTWASESLALWIEKSLAGSVYAEGGCPHATDPAYDILSIFTDGATPRLRITQVKATESNLQANSNAAITKFERLETGFYDAELSSRLQLLERRRDLPISVDAKELLYDSSRRYRVTVIHSENRTGFSILTQYAAKIPGDIERRSACLINVDWPQFWTLLGRKVYDQLS